MKLSTLLKLALVLAALAAGAGWYLWQKNQDRLPAGIAMSNGRIEAEEVNIATKYAGRVAEVLVREGDPVSAGQVVARMDAAEMTASLEHAEAAVGQAREAVAEARAQIAQRQAELTLAEREFDRTLALFRSGNAARERVDQRLAVRDGARSALAAAQSRLASAERAVEVAAAEARRVRTQLDDLALRAPRDGRVQYRLAEPGEVLAAGGRVLTLIDLAEVYMTIFLPTREAGQVRIGGEARIVPDAAPHYVVPAAVSFVSDRAQFTPKEVETRSEREKLMFRVKLRIDPALLRVHAARVKTGLPGEAYVRLDPAVPWPERLAVKLPPPPLPAQ